MTDENRKPEDAETPAGEPAAEAESPEAPAAAPEGEAAPELPSPEQELAELRAENEKLRDQLLRALADAENTRRRAQRDKEDTARFAVAGFARDLLTTADNLRRALDAVPQDARQQDQALAALMDGVEVTERELLSVFERHGLTKVDPLGEKFDPNYHQAMYEVPGSGQIPGTVAHVMQPGYVLNGRLIRPAMVGVAKGEPPQKVDEKV
jgi:molecular chaperone GrpE